jgi:aminoglycoside 6-adenylyltransferase
MINERLLQLLAKVLDWAKSQPDIRAMALTGSGARRDHPADEWSDLDLVVIATEPSVYLMATDWLIAIDKVWFTFLEKSSTGEPFERRALFEDGSDVDFMFLSPETLSQDFYSTPLPEIMGRGVRVLLDKDDLLAGLPGDLPPEPVSPRPTPQAFIEAVNDFWFHAAWTAKKLKRGELWTAKMCCDIYMKGILLNLVAWHARATRSEQLDTWFNGRFLEEWAAPQVVRELRDAFAYYDEEEVWRALTVSMALFHRVAQETAARWQYHYPGEGAEKMIAWVAECHRQ